MDKYVYMSLCIAYYIGDDIQYLLLFIAAYLNHNINKDDRFYYEDATSQQVLLVYTRMVIVIYRIVKETDFQFCEPREAKGPV